jgi:single-strand DNA-binding protein
VKHTSITVVGNMITPVNRRNLPDGRPVASFRIACTERRVDRATGAWGDGETFYIGVTCWRELAENVASSLGVGDPIIVRGRIYTSTYDDRDGKRTSVQEIDADAVGPDLARCRVGALVRNRRPGPGGDAPAAAGEPEGASPAEPADVTALHALPAAPQPEPVPAGGR